MSRLIETRVRHARLRRALDRVNAIYPEDSRDRHYLETWAQKRARVEALVERAVNHYLGHDTFGLEGFYPEDYSGKSDVVLYVNVGDPWTTTAVLGRSGRWTVACYGNYTENGDGDQS